MQNHISLYEYSNIRYQICRNPLHEGFDEATGILHISEESLDKLSALTEDVNFAEIYHDRIRTLNYAGVAKFGSLELEILPKFFRNGDLDTNKPRIMKNLLCMLQHSDLGNFREINSADLDSTRNDFFEVMVFLFAKNLARVLKNRQEQRYIRQQDELRFVREKIISKKYGTNPARLHIIPCEFHDRSMDTLMNRTFRFTARILLNQVKNPETYRYLKYILSVFNDVSPERVFPSEIRKIRFDRMNSLFRPYVKFCELFLSHSTITLQASDIEFFSFMIPMEKLFESFIAEMLGEYKTIILPAGPAYEVLPQHYLGNLAYEGGHGHFAMIPDIFLKGTPPVILDTKYKILSVEDRNFGISQQDIYQMYAYCRESGARAAILLYPAGINTHLPEHTFTMGREDPIELHVKTISLDQDLSKDEGIREFLEQFREVFGFMSCDEKIQSLAPENPGILLG